MSAVVVHETELAQLGPTGRAPSCATKACSALIYLGNVCRRPRAVCGISGMNTGAPRGPEARWTTGHCVPLLRTVSSDRVIVVMTGPVRPQVHQKVSWW